MFNIGINSKKEKYALIYTKNGQGYVHKNIPTSIKALEEICKLENIRTDAGENSSLFTVENFRKYDVIIFSFHR